MHFLALLFGLLWSQMMPMPGPGIAGSGGAGGGPTLISVACATPTTNYDATLTLSTTGATLLLAIYSYYVGGGSTVALSDTVGGNHNTWTPLTLYTDSGNFRGILTSYVLAPPYTGASHVFDAVKLINGASPPFIGACYAAFSGITTFESGKDAGAASASGYTQAPGSLTPTLSNSLVITGLSQVGGASATYSVGSGFSVPIYTDSISGNSEATGLSYLIHGATAVNPLWTSSVNSGAIVANLAIFH